MKNSFNSVQSAVTGQNNQASPINAEQQMLFENSYQQMVSAETNQKLLSVQQNPASQNIQPSHPNL